jgi:lysozyme
MKISAEGLALIKKFEGCELEAYQDAVGVWTIGYGHIKGVKEGMTITKEQAEEMLLEELVEYENYVLEAVNHQLDQCMFDALVSWTYNLGPSNLNSSTMLSVLNDKQYNKVPSEMKRWNKAGGEILDGLVRRREAESLLFEGKDWYEV